MCAAVAVIPVTEIFALTERSSLIVTVPLPDAAVVTGGTSFAPDRVTDCPPIMGIDWQLARTPSAPATATAVIQCEYRIILFMAVLRDLGLPPALGAGRRAKGAA